MMVEDAEAKAIQGLVGVLEPLEDDARKRVVTWAAQRYGIVTPGAASNVAMRSTKQESPANVDFAGFSDLFAAAAPTTESEMALVGGWWQTSQGNTDFSSQIVNDQLKHLGHPLTNATRAFDWLRSQTPALVMQVQKSGKTKQARKLYRLTQAGAEAVRQMISKLKG